ncbi:2TM domain-containing protein [Halopseudomonas yangmingensis]|uniref:Helix-turn-helix n=1 Tax=Halopseudomonas yangmingensis TaxID=1720063 RepID=A0A1I4QGW1_9GAMM|nr:2TM domain-containing protein [Halopseudomonas yangmingensis]SFM39299.1 Helix-turn-helix [Halopseudomonas yangmingensis]
MSVQKLRLRHGWSQQQLADASGLSVRTVQRIEAGQPASVETLKSLAAVFQVEFSTLDPEQSMHNPSDSQAAQQEAEAFNYVRRLRGFYRHLICWVAVILLLLAINLLVTPHRLWVLWVIAGWGIGLALHAFRVFRPVWLFGPEWERRQVEKRLSRPL